MNTMEAHTSDLTANCLRAVQLRHEGKVIGESPTALVRGSLAGETLRLWHLGHGLIESCVDTAIIAIEKAAQEERRPITSGCRKAMPEIVDEVSRACAVYASTWREGAELLGVEVPVRMMIDVDSEPVEFASHLDLLYRLDGTLFVDDWKWREEQPTAPYLARNMQLAMYCWAVRHGSVEIDGTWHQLGEWPIARWIDLAAHKPYLRKSSYTDQDTGEVIECAKGDTRPAHIRARLAPITGAGLPAIRAEFELRVRMARAGFWPTNPDPIGCMCCASRVFCTDFSGASR